MTEHTQEVSSPQRAFLQCECHNPRSTRRPFSTRVQNQLVAEQAPRAIATALCLTYSVRCLSYSAVAGSGCSGMLGCLQYVVVVVVACVCCLVAAVPRSSDRYSVTTLHSLLCTMVHARVLVATPRCQACSVPCCHTL